MINIIGDSHVCAFVYKDSPIFEYNIVKQNENFSAIRTPPYVAYNLYDKIQIINNDINMFGEIKENDYLFFCYGEVDIRCHIGFVADKNNQSYKEACKDVVDRYFIFIRQMKNLYKNVGIYGPIPSGSSNVIQGNGQPSYKTQKERQIITNIFNELLKQKCKEENVLFKNLESIPTDSNDYYFDDIHLTNKIQPALVKLFADLK